MKEKISLDPADVRECVDLLTRLLNKSNERDLVLVATGHLEKLNRLAVAKLVPGLDLSFNEKLKILVARGLLAEEAKNILSVLWELRGRFSHDSTECSLSDSSSGRTMEKLHQSFDSLIEGDLKNFREKFLAEAAAAAVGAEVNFMGDSEMQYLAFSTLILCLNLLAAKARVREPQSPPKLEECIIEWGMP